jgi:hypothetical protein
MGMTVISDPVNGRSQAAVCKKADLHKPKRIQKSKVQTEADSKSELHTEADWKRIGSGLEADWKGIGRGWRANSVGNNNMRHTTYDIRRFSA